MKKKMLALSLTVSLLSAALAGCNQGGTETPAETSPIPLVEAESGSGATVTGKALSPDQLVDFVLDTEWARSYVDQWYVGEFLDGLDDPAWKELYCRALTLVRLISTDNLVPADAVCTQVGERAQLQVDGTLGYYIESGYTYESFLEAFYAVFTKETADTIFSRYPFFCSYNGELWFLPTSAGGNVGEVFQEYELIEQTETALSFKRISYSVALGEPLTDYDPAKKDEYNKTEVDFRFVRTEDGWRAAEFLNATDYDQSMLPS